MLTTKNVRLPLRESEDQAGVNEMQEINSLKWLTKKVFEQTSRKLKKKPSQTRLHLDLEQVVSSLKSQSAKDTVSSQIIVFSFISLSRKNIFHD